MKKWMFALLALFGAFSLRAMEEENSGQQRINFGFSQAYARQMSSSELKQAVRDGLVSPEVAQEARNQRKRSGRPWSPAALVRRLKRRRPASSLSSSSESVSPDEVLFFDVEEDSSVQPLEASLSPVPNPPFHGLANSAVYAQSPSPCTDAVAAQNSIALNAKMSRKPEIKWMTPEQFAEDARRRKEEDARRRKEEDARRRKEEDARRRKEEDSLLLGECAYEYQAAVNELKPLTFASSEEINVDDRPASAPPVSTTPSKLKRSGAVKRSTPNKPPSRSPFSKGKFLEQRKRPQSVPTVSVGSIRSLIEDFNKASTATHSPVSSDPNLLPIGEAGESSDSDA